MGLEGIRFLEVLGPCPATAGIITATAAAFGLLGGRVWEKGQKTSEDRPPF